MSTNMAEGAAQRLVAQIGEALFGQPGLTLMELAEKVKASRSLLSNSDVLEVVARYVGKTSAAYRYIAEDLATRHAANMDDAQPSPAGQGVGVSISDDDRAVLQRLQDALPTAGVNGWAKGAEVLERLLRDSLAARQPVGSEYIVSGTMEDAEAASDGMLPAALVPVADEWYRLCERRFAVDRICISGQLAEAIVEAVCSARQPVGQENPLMPYVDSYRRMAKIGSGRVSCTAVAYDIERNMAPHAAPSAQPVDLSAVRDAVQGITLGFDGDLPYVKGIAEALALIDSQAVGK